jgi:hypothetical protein
VAVFCLIDARVKNLGCLRARGPTWTLFGSEVLTIEEAASSWDETKTRNTSSTSGATRDALRRCLER